MCNRRAENLCENFIIFKEKLCVRQDGIWRSGGGATVPLTINLKNIFRLSVKLHDPAVLFPVWAFGEQKNLFSKPRIES